MTMQKEELIPLLEKIIDGWNKYIEPGHQYSSFGLEICKVCYGSTWKKRDLDGFPKDTCSCN